MAIDFYYSTPINLQSNVVDLVDTYVGDGITTTFTLVNKTVSQLAATIQAGNIEYYFYNGGFTINSGANTFTLATAPPVGTQIVAPGIQQLTIAAFDQTNVLNVVNPNIQQSPFWLCDPTTINNLYYEPLPGYPGIQISLVQLISGANAQLSWFQMACADASGNALTYGATGAPLYTGSLSAFTTLVCTTSSLGNILYVGSASAFTPGDYVSVNIGAPTQEILHVIATNTSSNPNQLILDPSGTVYAHYPSELVFDCARKFWLQITVPENANDNQPVNVYNIGLQRLGSVWARP